MPSPLEVRLLGACELRIHGVVSDALRSRKGLNLLVLLLMENGREVDRTYISGLLWPDSAQEQAFYNLRQLLVTLRKALGDEERRLISPGSRTLRFDMEGVVVDALEFDRAVSDLADREALARGVALYKGAFLHNSAEEWAILPREEREQNYLRALETLSEHHLNSGANREAVYFLRLIIALDPLRESAQRSLMLALANNGERSSAELVYRELRATLLSEMNTEPAQETKALYQQIRLESKQPPAIENRANPVTVEPPPPAPELPSEPVGGAMSLDSPYYITRPISARFMSALKARHSIILVKGARQMGKTSLLARGLHTAREEGTRVVLTDFRAFSATQLATQEGLLMALAQDLAEQLDLDESPDAMWDEKRSGNRNIERYLRNQVLNASEQPLVWGFDEVDALFSREYSSNIFGLFRSWYNRRALEPDSPWNRLSLVLVYATEAHLFIQNRNQSPFNVGTEIPLSDFMLAEVGELNERRGSPLRTSAETERFHRLLNGHPYLTQLGLATIAGRGMTLDEVEAQADRNEGVFGAHLRQMLADLIQDSQLTSAVRDILQGKPCNTPNEFYYLRSAGVLAGESVLAPRLRCPVYRSYLEHCLL
ncbi:MAG: AAA-like domain-containing protein [Armatimonadetes bacterium]|nr:AAA-like domain-containing protein [Armatimonadota bacterium]